MGLSCAAATSKPQAQGTGGAGDGGSGIGSAGGATDAGGAGSGFNGCGREATCSADLQQVLCDGQVSATCAPGETCSGGVCSNACSPAELGKNNVGCDYYATTPDIYHDFLGSCYAAILANTGNQPVEISVQIGGTQLRTADFARVVSNSGPRVTYAPLPGGALPPGEIAVLFLQQSASGKLQCPPDVSPARGISLTETGRTSSFHIRTSGPVTAYDIYPYGGATSTVTSASLLLPTTAWGKDYLAVELYDDGIDDEQFYAWQQILAAEDATEVTIDPTAAIEGGRRVEGTAQGQPITYTLQQGEVLELAQLAGLPGSAVRSNKPIGLVSGNRCTVIPAGTVACDGTHQVIPPVNALGSEYVAVKHRNRFDDIEEAPPWRMMGAADGTVLTYDPAPPADAPISLERGQVAEFRAGEPFVVRSQDGDHPFYMSAHMTSCGDVQQGADCRGDPEAINVIPAAQFLSNYIFLTDPTYPDTSLVVVRERGPEGFKDVVLDCTGPIQGFQPVGNGGKFEYARVDLIRGNFQPQGSCINGRHEAKSDAPFGVTVWGWGSKAASPDVEDTSDAYFEATSYAYPVGASVERINNVDTTPR